jgi:hypothetical protein
MCKRFRTSSALAVELLTKEDMFTEYRSIAKKLHKEERVANLQWRANGEHKKGSEMLATMAAETELRFKC